MSSAKPATNDNKGKAKMSPQEIFDGFKRLREEQRYFMSKIQELESDKQEHHLVLDTLQEVPPDRKCFRLLGGVLVERTVGEVLPALRQNMEQISAMVTTLNEQMVDKGKEINEYKELHNIRIQGEGAADSKSNTEAKNAPQPEAGGILVGHSA